MAKMRLHDSSEEKMCCKYFKVHQVKKNIDLQHTFCPTYSQSLQSVSQSVLLVASHWLHFLAKDKQEEEEGWFSFVSGTSSSSSHASLHPLFILWNQAPTVAPMFPSHILLALLVRAPPCPVDLKLCVDTVVRCCPSETACLGFLTSRCLMVL